MTTATAQIRDALLFESLKCMGRTSPNPPVGAVLLAKTKTMQIFFTGATEMKGGRHAEIVCIDKYLHLCKHEPIWEKARLHLYTSLEPCSHFGHTPPCTSRILEIGQIESVLSWIRDPFLEISGIKILRDAGLKANFINPISSL